MVTSGAASGTVSVARCGGSGGATEDMGEAQLPAAEGTGSGSPPVVTALLAAPRPQGGVIAVVGCDTGELFLLDCVARGQVTVTAMERAPGGGGGGGGGAGTPETPSKWGMFSSTAVSATKAALRYLRDAGEVGPDRYCPPRHQTH